MMNQSIRKKITGIRIISIGTFLGCLISTGVVLGQSYPPRPPVRVDPETVRPEAEAERDPRGEGEVRVNDPARAITRYVNGGPIPTRPADVARPTPANIRPAYEPPLGTSGRPATTAPFIPVSQQQRAAQARARTERIRIVQQRIDMIVRLEAEPSSELLGQLRAELEVLNRRQANETAIKILDARIETERNPEYRDILLRERERLEAGGQ